MRLESVMLPVLRQVIKRPRVSEAFFRFDSWGNSFSAENTADPYLMLDAIRADGPVIHKKAFRQWFVAGYEEARQVLSSPDATVSQQMEVLLDVRPYSQLSPRSQGFFRDLLLLIDPPRHTRLRSLVNRAFTPRQVTGIEGRMATIVDDLIADFSGDQIDLMDDFAVPFPAYVIAQLLGVPTERWEWIRAISNVFARGLDVFRGFDPTEMDRALDDFRDYVVGLAKERLTDPKDDLISALAQVEDAGDRLTEDELVAIVGILLFAGHETTGGMFGNSICALARYREQRDLVRSNPTLWPNAIEELLRFDTALKSDPRVAERDLVVGDTTIPAGQNIVVMLGVANRDPRRFDHPDTLQLDRPDPSPLSFGHGIHFCLGANLARTELRIGLPRLLAALGDYVVDPAAVEWKQSITLRSPTRLPVQPGLA